MTSPSSKVSCWWLYELEPIVCLQYTTNLRLARTCRVYVTNHGVHAHQHHNRRRDEHNGVVLVRNRPAEELGDHNGTGKEERHGGGKEPVEVLRRGLLLVYHDFGVIDANQQAVPRWKDQTRKG